ncbi:Dynein light chain LC6, flagellar outer [Musa troglodytarum]|uniref:Dynein light chain LC6, flagellar outer n=1 Tax=Musa troglodytarum TaxID=320322 RepID=A0A9E7IDV9_9LILI|nr:Dynein light chain LC6, flagellar outer [Musa troglodytarum]
MSEMTVRNSLAVQSASYLRELLDVFFEFRGSNLNNNGTRRRHIKLKASFMKTEMYLSQGKVFMSLDRSPESHRINKLSKQGMFQSSMARTGGEKLIRCVHANCRNFKIRHPPIMQC